MPSPFPGMNPYLERQSTWDTFHTLFIGEALRQLAPGVHPKYQVLSGSRLYIHEPSADERRFFAQADAGLVTSQPTAHQSAPSVATLPVPKYRAIPACVIQERVGFIEIRDADGNEVVTVVELLSRTNNIPKEDRELFLNKRHEILLSSCHYVELNLLRAGRPLPYEPSVVGPYYCAVSRAESRDRVETWEWGLRDPIPGVPIPLRLPDRDAFLDVKAVIDRVYDDSRLSPWVYTRPPDPPLAPEDEAWAKGLVAAAA